MNKIEGLHHLAISTASMKEQIEFFTDKLGMELQALYWMHGVAKAWHGFLRLNDESSIAFVCHPDIASIEVVPGQTHAGHAGGQSARGTMQHLALRVKNNTELLLMRDRLRTKGVPVIGPVEHGMCCSIYFAGPENLTLELSYSTAPINSLQWIDPEVVRLAGISEDELRRFKNPPSFEIEANTQPGSVLQPDIAAATGPHLSNYPPGVYEKIMGRPDDLMLHSVPSDPPVRVR
ncbi:MAG: VOC family protein [Burkholderiaceae bacterium]